jgi:hypothetical protein
MTAAAAAVKRYSISVSFFKRLCLWCRYKLLAKTAIKLSPATTLNDSLGNKDAETATAATAQI